MSRDTITEAHLIAPPRALVGRNPLQWFRFFGPGAILASITIGSGEVLFSSRGGSIFGYRILWVFLWIGILKWVLAYGSARHMILTGGHPFDRWGGFRGPRGWFPLFMILISVFCYPIWYSFLAGLLGTACAWIFGVGDLYLWATIFIVVSILILLASGYSFLEKTQLAILLIKVSAIFFAVVYLRPDWLSALKGFVVPQALNYPDWLFEKLPYMRERSAWLEVLVYASAIGGTALDYLGYVSFLREKKWGWSHLGVAPAEQLEQAAANPQHPSRLWLRAALVDTITSFVMVILLSTCFSVLGTVVLQPRQLVPEGINLLNYQASFLTSVSSWLLPVYKLCIFFVFFAIICGGPELFHRVFYEYLNSLPRWRGRVPARKLRFASIAWCLGGAAVILWLSRSFPGVQLIDIVTPAALYTGVLGCGFFCLANAWADWRFLPPALRMPRAFMWLNIMGGGSFTLMGLKALWDYGQYTAYLTLGVLVLLSMILSISLRFLYRAPAAADLERAPEAE